MHLTQRWMTAMFCKCLEIHVLTIPVINSKANLIEHLQRCCRRGDGWRWPFVQLMTSLVNRRLALKPDILAEELREETCGRTVISAKTELHRTKYFMFWRPNKIWSECPAVEWHLLKWFLVERVVNWLICTNWMLSFLNMSMRCLATANYSPLAWPLGVSGVTMQTVGL